MKLIPKATIAIPIIGGSIWCIYHNYDFPGVLSGVPSILQNRELMNDLQKSKYDNYSTHLIGYEEKIDNPWRFDKVFKHQNGIWTTFTRHKTVSLDEAKKKLEILRDYSVKLETPCGHGTGWILDYIKPEKTEKYPTKWFIATNAHVIENMSFESNPYYQQLPRKGFTGCGWKKYGHTPLAIIKEDLTGISHSWDIDYYTKRSDRSWLSYAIDQNPKLFYVPINYLGTSHKNVGYKLKRHNYYKDFAVLEINLPEEELARKITSDFYSKYDLTTGTHKQEALNLFAKELIEETSGNGLIENGRKNYFISGYASNGLQDISLSNYDVTRSVASKLTYLKGSDRNNLQFKNKHNQPIIGHVDIGKIDDNSVGNRTTVSWGGRQLTNWGYNYVLDNTRLSSGASGSLSIDKDRNVLGLYRMHDPTNNLGFVEPLRSQGIYQNGKIISPKYDLIEGVSGQINSFKSQIEKYYLNKGKQTNLSQYRNWNRGKT